MGAISLNNYKVLGLKPDCTYGDIKSAYYRLAKIYHPDNQTTGDAEKFLEISTAYDSLMKSLELPQGNVLNKKCYVPDIFIKVQLTLKEAFNGKTIKFVADDGKERTIKIPCGVYSKRVVVVKNKGNTTVQGTTGDIIATILIQREDGYSFEEGVLVRDCDVDIIKAITGGRETIQHIDGKILRFDVPQGFNEGYTLTISKRGWRKLKSTEQGDLILKLHIKNRMIELTDKEIRQLKSIGNK